MSLPVLRMCVTSSGQFSREPAVIVHDIHEGADPLKKEATMEVKGNSLQVTRYVVTKTASIKLISECTPSH